MGLVEELQQGRFGAIGFFDRNPLQPDFMEGAARPLLERLTGLEPWQKKKFFES
jgi:hypothetical protein